MSKPVHKTVLIDDSEIDLFIQRRFLEVYNFTDQLVSFKSAREAINNLQNINGEPAPDVIFLDLNMPEIDGFGFLKTFETFPEKITGKSKIVVLTSSNSSKDREQAFENKNVIHFITKPLKESDLEELQRLIRKN